MIKVIFDCICGLECKTSESKGMKMCRHCSVPRGSVLMITMLKDLRNSAQKRQSRWTRHLIHGSYHSCSSGRTLDNILRQYCPQVRSHVIIPRD